jgi:hypothetical protein
VLGTDGLAAVVELFREGNPVSDSLASGVVLPSARTVDVAREMPGVAAQSIARTAPSAWVMSDPARARRGDEPSVAKRDAKGPASVMVLAELAPAGENAQRGGHLVVVGDADFASDAYLDLLGNRDLALNATAWAAGEEVMTGARAASSPQVMRPLSPLVLTEPQARAILIAGAVVQPGIVLALGLVVVGLRRRRG